MTYNFINGKFIIAKLYDEFNIKSSDWETRAPRWIADALSNLGAFKSLKQVNEPIKFTNHTFKLPCDTKVLRGISINGVKLDRVTNVNYKETNKEVSKYIVPSGTYYLDNGEVSVEFEEGIAHVSYLVLPVEWDDELGMWIPMIPNKFKVVQNITWYVLKLILARGYIHPLYSLTTNNPLLNPSILWRDTTKGAKLAINSMDNEERRIMADTLSRFLSNPRADAEELFSMYTQYSQKTNEPVHTFDDLLKE